MDKFLKILQLKKDIKAGKEICTRKHRYMKLTREGTHSNHPIKSVSSLFHCTQPRIVHHHLKTYVLENVPNAS